MANAIEIVQIIILGYLLGSVPFGVLLAKLFRLPDPRSIGSGNIGATNMLRTGNKKVAALTLLLDAGKGAAAVWISQKIYFYHHPPSGIFDCFNPVWLAGLNHYLRYLALAVFAAAFGHMASPWLKFKGGKGVATILGGALAFSWPVGMAGVIIWLLLVLLKRYVSLGSIAALAVMPLVAWLRVDATSAALLALACALAIWKHRENIKRLRHGFEPKLSLGRKA